jgi:hypothetical protein
VSPTGSSDPGAGGEANQDAAAAAASEEGIPEVAVQTVFPQSYLTPESEELRLVNYDDMLT